MEIFDLAKALSSHTSSIGNKRISLDCLDINPGFQPSPGAKFQDVQGVWLHPELCNEPQASQKTP